MNKITSILAGVATVAAVSVAPAFAQGNLFSPPGTFSFVTTAAGAITVTGTGETFNPIAAGSAPITPVSFTLMGTQIGASNFFNLTNLTVTGTNVGGTGVGTFTETGALRFSLQTDPTGIVSIASQGAAADGTTFNLVSSAPVPETSTVVSFGALLALGGLALVARRKSVKNVA